MKKICVVTAARSEYGPLKWLIHDIEQCPDFQLQLIATGGHLLAEQGETINQIKEDGFEITYIVDAKLDTSSPARIAESMGRMSEGFAKAFEFLEPDYILVLGDRYELLPICNTAFIMRIPIIHLSGGDVTEGALDDGIRNAVTMLADYHFPGTIDSAKNIIRMRGSDKNVWAVGEPGLDSFCRETLMSREMLAKDLNLDESKKWVLMTFHAETKKSMEYNLQNVSRCINALLKHDECQIVITYANADFGGEQINEYIEKQADKYSNQLRVVPSLGHYRYLSYMKQVMFVIGNSSSGIVEAPFLNVPVINVGDRQKGRYQCMNIRQVDVMKTDIDIVINEIINSYDSTISEDLFYWGDGHTSEKIINYLKIISM